MDEHAKELKEETAFLEPKLMEKNLQRLREKGGVALFPESKVTAYLSPQSHAAPIHPSLASSSTAQSKPDGIASPSALPSSNDSAFRSFLVVNCRASKAAQFYKSQHVSPPIQPS